MSELDKPMAPYDSEKLYLDQCGLTIRQHAAIAMRVPMGGDPELDAMIREARRLDMATAAMPMIRECLSAEFRAKCAYDIADALLAASEPKKAETMTADEYHEHTGPAQEFSDAEGWIEWHGKNYCPTSEGACVEIMFRGGMTIRSTTASAWSWNHCGKDGDIIAYRIVKE